MALPEMDRYEGDRKGVAVASEPKNGMEPQDQMPAQDNPSHSRRHIPQRNGTAPYLNIETSQNVHGDQQLQYPQAIPLAKSIPIYVPTRRLFASSSRAYGGYNGEQWQERQSSTRSHQDVGNQVPHPDRVHVESTPAGSVVQELKFSTRKQYELDAEGLRGVASDEEATKLTIKDIILRGGPSPRALRVKYVASYTLMGTSKPTISVPGTPASWAPLEDPVPLLPDKGPVFADYNAAHNHIYPMASCVSSILTLSPNLETQDIDIVGCEETLYHVIRYLKGQESSFRFLARLVGRTLFLVRNEGTRAIPSLKGWGHSFLAGYTRWPGDLNESISHQRVVGYNFAGMEMLVRFECDGYYESMEKQKQQQNKPSTSETRLSEMPAEFDSLVDLVDLVDPRVAAAAAEAGIEVQSLGTEVSQSTIFEIKTRARYREYGLEDRLPLLWLRQIPNMVIGYHYRGTFNNIQQFSVKEEVARWEAKNTALLRRFAGVLYWFKDTAQEMAQKDGIGQFEVYRLGRGPLQLRRVTQGREVIPPGLEHLWVSGQGKVEEGEVEENGSMTIL
ncbi:hypothetical protein MKZ38_003319 [Zalerion maritima]|uniref:Geranylgeranyl pyrophosphate synthetase n=1 Tax=Zalerion maritima TaxID=339359 RepID=A0AAD5RMX3_9PEZI|nr:hypothetical protein MKZ38_003319 [Zalerion maritima]